MTPLGWSELVIVLATLGSLVLQTALIVVAVWIALFLWHRRPHGRARD